MRCSPPLPDPSGCTTTHYRHFSSGSAGASSERTLPTTNPSPPLVKGARSVFEAPLRLRCAPLQSSNLWGAGGFALHFSWFSCWGDLLSIPGSFVRPCIGLLPSSSRPGVSLPPPRLSFSAYCSFLPYSSMDFSIDYTYRLSPRRWADAARSLNGSPSSISCLVFSLWVFVAESESGTPHSSCRFRSCRFFSLPA